MDDDASMGTMVGRSTKKKRNGRRRTPARQTTVDVKHTHKPVKTQNSLHPTEYLGKCTATQNKKKERRKDKKKNYPKTKRKINLLDVLFTLCSVRSWSGVSEWRLRNTNKTKGQKKEWFALRSAIVFLFCLFLVFIVVQMLCPVFAGCVCTRYISTKP